jgi:phospholipid/cholesterol/gamma-HCH transport system ATP-binding protein
MSSNRAQSDRQAPAIEFRQVSFSFDDEPALVDVSFQLPRGDILCITGESRSGKSVLLRLSIGLLQPDQGRVLVDGRDLGALTELQQMELRRGSMGVVFQDSSLFTGMSVYENAAYRLTEAGLPEEAVDCGAMEILRFVGLEQDADKLLEVTLNRNAEAAGVCACDGGLAENHAE